MKFKLLNKLFITTLIIFLVSLIFTSTILNFVISNHFAKEKYSMLKNNCESISEIVISDANSTNFKRNLYNILRVQNKASETDMFICDESGVILVCGCDSFLHGEPCIHYNHTIPEELLKSTKDDYAQISTLSNIYDQPYYVYGKQIKGYNNETVGYVFCSTTAESIREVMSRVSRVYIYSWIIPIIIMFIALYTATYNFTKPLKKMSSAAKRMAKGDFSCRISAKGSDEISELAQSFNYMSDSLAKLEKMRRSFVGNVSHELRTPMTTIAGFIDGIIDGTIEEDKKDYYLGVVSSEVKRLSRVVESMFSLAKLEAGEISINPTEFNLSETVLNVFFSREKQIEEKNINMVGLDSLTPTKITADSDLIYQVIYNLIDNAVKFTNVDGFIEIKIFEDSQTVRFEIKNSGPGISKQSIDYIFERFYKTDKSRSNNKDTTGLGLYIVKTIVDLHGGKIVADSVENEYTVFVLTLPRNTNFNKGNNNE